MESRIIFLGTAGDSFVLNRQKRTAAGIVLQHNNTQIHLNPGPNATLQAKLSGIDPTKTTAVVVTDNTLLHCHDAHAVIDMMTLGCFDTKGLLLAAKSAVKGDQPTIHQSYQDAVERTIILEQGNKVEYNGIQITGIPIKNSDHYAIGIKIITDIFSLAYIGKTKYTTKMKEDCKGVEILILELALLQLKKREDGLSLAEAEKLITEVKPQVAIVTGFGIEILKEDMLELTRNLNRTTHVQVIAAHDGFTFDPTSYAVTLRQKRLSIN